MTGLLRELRSLVLGETWSVPLGVALVVGVSAALHGLAPDTWSEWGGVVLVVGIVAVLWICTRERSKG